MNYIFTIIKPFGGFFLQDGIEDVLRGKALKIYLLLLKTGRPMRVREIQRKLKLSTPSLVIYHISKLHELGVVKKTENDLYYASELIKSSYLADFMKIKGFIFPRFLFYSMFSTLSLTVFLTFFRPFYITKTYLFSTVIMALFTVFMWFETYRFWKRHFSG